MSYSDPQYHGMSGDDYYMESAPYTAVRSHSHFEGVASLERDQYEYYEEELYDFPLSDVHQRMGLILPVVLGIILVLTLSLWALLRSNIDIERVVSNNQTAAVLPAEVQTAVAAAGGEISPIFTAEVQYWAPQIVGWANDFGLDPNMVATVMQIESCGDPKAISRSNAQGLFQVMPFHFSAGEDMLDPDTNARRGMNYLAERLVQTRGEVGHAFAGYNGGHVAAGSSWEHWANETQRYYTWSTGIYAEASAGETVSATLNEWLNAGGRSLCNQAAARLGLQ